jgi:hypothetical protein
MSQVEDWPTKYPWRLLPRDGRHPFVPPGRKDWLKNPPRGLNGGYADAHYHEWKPHLPPGGGEEALHWDVQHRDGRHTDVRPDGEIHHGDDNFP